MANMQRYVSRELTHFVGRNEPDEDARYSLLIKILKDGWLTFAPHEHKIYRGYAFAMGIGLVTNDQCAPNRLCFCDIPVGDLTIHMKKYSRFGLSFLKPFLIEKGANPVLYVCHESISLSGESRLQTTDKIVGKLMETYVLASSFFDNLKSDPEAQRVYDAYFELHNMLIRDVVGLFKPYSSELEDNDPNNYYMEREWRMFNNLNFTLEDVHRVILPKAYAKQFRKDVPDYYGQVTFVD